MIGRDVSSGLSRSRRRAAARALEAMMRAHAETTLIADRASAAIIWAADQVFGPWTLCRCCSAAGLFLTVRLRFVQVTRFREALRTMVPAAQAGGQGPALAVPGVHDGARRLDRHRQHRRRRHRDRDAAARARSSGSGSTASSRPRSSSPRRCSASATARLVGDRALRGPDALPARRPGQPRAGLDLRAGRRHRRAHHDALHAAQLDRGRAGERARRPDAGSPASASRCSPGS